MAEDLIRYDLLVQDALRGVVRKVLTQAARDGLQGEHHFFVSFRTDLPGVRVSQRLREKYPQEMTIVLQHQFWDLGVTEHAFEVGLSFSNIPERLLVPFSALTGFFDPSVQFGLKFEVAAPEPAEAPAQPAKPAPVTAAPPVPAPVPLPAKAPGTSPVPALQQPAPSAPAAKAAPAEAAKEPAKPAAKRDKAQAPDAGEAVPGAEVVSLDAFRKKN